MKNIKLILNKDAQDVGITNAVSCFIANIKVQTDNIALTTDINKVLSLVSDKRPISESVCYKGFKSLFLKLGYPNQLTACDRLIDYYANKGFKSINNIVDSYNICSVMYGSPIGLHDASKIREDVKIKRATGLEEIVPMFKEKSKKIKAGDLLYEVNGSTLCWMGKQDVDSDLYKVTNSTESVFIMAIGNENTSNDFNLRICSSIYDLILKSCPNAIFYQIPTFLE